MARKCSKINYIKEDGLLDELISENPENIKYLNEQNLARILRRPYLLKYADQSLQIKLIREDIRKFKNANLETKKKYI